MDRRKLFSLEEALKSIVGDDVVDDIDSDEGREVQDILIAEG